MFHTSLSPPCLFQINQQMSGMNLNSSGAPMAFGPPGAPWAAGWHPPPVRPSATSSGSKWMREDGGQGAPHPSISPLLSSTTTCAQSFIHVLSFFPPFSFQPLLLWRASIQPALCIDQVSESTECKRLAALTVLFAIIFFFYIYIFGGFKIHISYKKAAGPIIQASNISLPNQ